MMKDIIHLLHTLQCSCVIAQGNDTRSFHQRGVADLYTLVCQEPDFLNGASIADKVVGKAAAALMVKGKIRELYADTISLSALTLLRSHRISVEFGKVVPYIYNRDHTGWCPLEARCYKEESVDSMFQAIGDFLKSLTSNSSKSA